MSVRSAPPLPGGTELAPGYEVVAHLSRGRRLDVYDAWSAERWARCIVKVLRPERRDEEAARAKLIREGELLVALTHPNIVRGYETIAEPHPVVVMETLGGETLGHMIQSREAPLEPAELGHLGMHITSAIAYLHANGILHLDVKPDNIVAEAGRAKLIDMSLVRPPGPAPAGIGTWAYLAPEQARGGDLGPAADIWGIGATLFEAATGEPAFDDPDEDELSGSISSDSRPTWDSGGDEDIWEGDYPQLEEPAPPVGSLRELPDELEALIDRCLREDPRARPTARELMEGLERVAGLPPEHRRFG